jgi:hypothetical protein
MSTPTIGYFGERLDIKIRQGATFGPIQATMRNPVVSPATIGTLVNLTGCTIRGQIRRKALDVAIIASFSVTITDAVNGEYEFGLTSSTTVAITAGEDIKSPTSKYVWDLELVDATGRITPLYYGDVTVLREVTR